MTWRVLQTIWRWSPLLFVLSIPLLLVVGEWHYTYTVSPEEVHTVDDHLARFGMPEFITPVTRKADPEIYYELSGFPNSKPPRLAFPSSRPAYIYDASGSLVDWCRDPGDTDKWHKLWRRNSESIFDVQPLIDQLQNNAAQQKHTVGLNVGVVHITNG